MKVCGPSGPVTEAEDITEALHLGGLSGPVTEKLRWPGRHIRWPRANGPVLTTSLQYNTRLQTNCNLELDTCFFVVSRKEYHPTIEF